MAKGKKLTGKQESFCQEYIKDFNATRSAKAAGYSERTAQVLGSETLANPLVAKRIAELMEERNKRVQLDQDYVLTQLMDCQDAAREDRAHGPRIRSIELMGKHVGMWQEKSEPRTDITIKIVEADESKA